MKRLLRSILLILVIGCLAGCAYSIKSNYVENKEMTLTFSYGERTGVYTGEIEKGIPEGTGTFVSVNDENEKWTYTGDWKQGVMDGRGTCDWENGGKYEGEYKAGYMDGEGSWYHDGELVYKGTYLEGRLIALNREILEIADSEPRQYVQMGEVGFQIPKAWTYEVVDNNTVYVKIPEADNVGIVYSVSEETHLSDEIAREGLKNHYISEYGKEYPEYRIVSENYDSGMVPEYDLHFTFYADDAIADVYSNAVSKSSGTYVLTVVQVGGTVDYSEAAMCIKNTMKNWDAIQDDIAEMANEQAKQNAMQYLVEEVDWEGLEAAAPKVSADEIINHKAPQEQIILVEGIIDNISDESFDLWIPYGTTYYKDDEWNYDIELGDITEGNTVEICIETHSDGSLKQTDGILAIRKLDVAMVQDIVSVFKDSCPPMDYKTIMRDPDKAYGTICKASGTVLQVVETESYMQEFLLELTDGNIVYVAHFKDEDADNVLEDDKVIVYGTFYVTETYTTLLGERKTVPCLSADYVDLR